MRKVLVSLAFVPLCGCAVPVGNLAALQGEGLQLGTRFDAAGPLPREAYADPAVPAAGTLYAALVQPWWYAKAEAGLIPVASLGTGGSVSAGLHWKDRIAVGPHLVINQGIGSGCDLAVRPVEGQPWVAGLSWTPQQLFPTDTNWSQLPRAKVGAAHDLEWSVGWSPAPSDHPDGALSIEAVLRHGTDGWIAGVRVSAAVRLFAPEGR